MKLGTRGRYAVMAVIDLAIQEKELGQPVSLSAIAERQEISLSYLEQLFSKLRHQKVLISVRGASGGYLLARPPEHITVADVVMAVDEPIHATRCLPRSSRGCLKNGSRCQVHHLWDALGNHIYHFLQTVTIADVCAKKFDPECLSLQQAKVG